MFEPRVVASRVREASRIVSTLPSAIKNAVLLDLAGRLDSSAGALMAANGEDMEAARAEGLPEAKLRRLELTAAGIGQMSEGLRQVAALPDPVGVVTRDDVVASGLRVQKVRCPLGVVMMIYEARPGVTVDAFALCLKAGNACLLKGGREAARSNAALAELLRASLESHGAPADSVALVTTSDRERMRELLQLADLIDLVIPRGGRGLIDFVRTNSAIPTVQHDAGVCHAFVHASADLDVSERVCVSAKTSSPATCNTLECVLIDRDIAPAFVPRLLQAYAAAGVEVRGDDAVRAHAGGLSVTPASEADWGTEYLDLIVAVRVVDGLEGACAHIHRYGSNHTDVILAQDEGTIEAFLARVQSSCVLANASPRFNDGFQLGLGAEIGISTTRLHAYGAMGLEELTTQRYVVRGSGQTR
ncbi:MAG: glutamate-5-semialdehyde dehydrogenase [Phycisphaerales bacterium]|nr:MAG: glutamate-5-semialdehyde dehydrogenase [Phycisphaerales bacterium]